MKKTLLALASIALVSSAAFSAHAADINPIKVRSVQAVLGDQKIKTIKVKNADNVSISAQNVQVNVDLESKQQVGPLKIDVAALGLVTGAQKIKKIDLQGVKTVDIGQTNVGVGIKVKLD